MNKRTSNIILILKGNHNYDVDISPREAVRQYLADYASVSAENIPDRYVDETIYKTAEDYIDTCDSPSTFIREYINHRITFPHFSEMSAWISALRQSKVQDGKNHFLNGWNQFNCTITPEE